jgi:malate dehydrogenase
VVQQRGAAVIAARGASSAFSAAQALIDHVKSLVTATPAGDWFSAAVVSDGSYGSRRASSRRSRSPARATADTAS